MTIGKLEVTTEEFQYLYEKNYANTDSLYIEEHLQDYLELYTRFKLKVAEAYSRGYDTTKAFTSELSGYQKQLAKPYLTDPAITDRIVKEAYDRMKTEVRAAHILIMVKDWGNPEDTLKAYQKVLDLKKQANEGADFSMLAAKHSEDPSAKMNNGDLGYFTSMQMVYEFESAAYKAAIGEVTGPVRTRFGYHLIKTIDKREAQGSCKASHIMIRYTEGQSEKDSLAASEKAHEIYKQLQNGGDWNNLCKQFSEDVNTKGKGGDLPWFTTGQMVPAFANAAFALKESGDIAAPVLSPYGWHIIKLEGKKGIESMEDAEKGIRQRISRDSRSELSQRLFIDKLKKENGFEEVLAVKAKAFASFDSTLLLGQWSVPLGIPLAGETLIKMNKKSYTVQDFFLFVAQKQQGKIKLSTAVYAQSLYDTFVDESIMSYEEEHLGEKYPDYRHLLNEYKEGIMLFNIMSEEVWEKAMADTSALRDYFNKNTAKYQWGKRTKAIIASVADKALLEKVKQDLSAKAFPVDMVSIPRMDFASGAVTLESDHERSINQLNNSLRRHTEYTLQLKVFYASGEQKSVAEERIAALQAYWKNYEDMSERISIEYQQLPESSNAMGGIESQVLTPSPKGLEKTYNADNALALEIYEGWFEKGEKQALDAVDWKVGNYTTEVNGRMVYVIIQELDEPRSKKLKECRGQVIADYQQHLEDQWIASLRQKYEVVLNQKAVKAMMKAGKKKKKGN